MRLSSALDNEVNIAVSRLLANGVVADPIALYTAIQKSNSSLKRQQKKAILSSIERVLDLTQAGGPSEDEEAEAIERTPAFREIDPDIMNRSLRGNLTPRAEAEAVADPTNDEATRKRRLANGEPLSKRQKPEKSKPSFPTDVSLDDVGGMGPIVRQMGSLLIQPLLTPELYAKLGVSLPRGILLHGPPGCGKTMLTRALAAQLEVPFIEIPGPSIVSSMSGDSEKGLREKFEEAKKHAPCLLFIDELDAIAPKRDSSQSQMEKRIVAQLLVCMDDLGKDNENPVIVLAATNRPDSLDPALRRGGRFDTEINIPVPNERVRESVLKAQTRHASLADNVDLAMLAKLTAGFVGSDLKDLIGKAGSWQMERYRDALRSQMNGIPPAEDMDDNELAIVELKNLIARLRRKDLPQPAGFEDMRISMAAFTAVLPTITPSSKREGFATVPDVSWDDIGALDNVRDELQQAVVEPIKHPEVFRALGMKASIGVLLWGPPGCGKTLLAKAAAAESKANFISVKGPELLNKFVGESEAAVRRVFTRARSSVPCILFFDEIDALAPRRDDAGSEATARVVNTLLSELDGLDDRDGIYIIAATNRPDIVDNAMLRPGRLDKPIFVDLPGPAERVEILTTMLRKKPVDRAAAEIARDCEGFSGADLGSLLHEAGNEAYRRASDRISVQDFEKAKLKIHGSVTDIERYYKLKKRFSGA